MYKYKYKLVDVYTEEAVSIATGSGAKGYRREGTNMSEEGRCQMCLGG
jgi:hypothetical protein